MEKKPDRVEMNICETQAMLYEAAARIGYDLKSFSEYFLNSEFCSRSMDTSYSRYQMADPGEIMDFLDMDSVRKTNICQSKGEAYWIGFMYRYLYYCLGKTSRQLMQEYPFRLMCRVYPGLHTLDEEMAADILTEGNTQKESKTIRTE